MAHIGDTIPADAIAQEMLRRIANAQKAVRDAEKIARSQRRGKKIVVSFADRKLHNGETVDWKKQDRIPVGKNSMSMLMSAETPSRGRTLALSAKAKQNKSKRK